jgi:hypothetical protein
VICSTQKGFVSRRIPPAERPDSAAVLTFWPGLKNLEPPHKSQCVVSVVAVVEQLIRRLNAIATSPVTREQYDRRMPDAAWWSGNETGAPCKPRPRERLWTLTKNGKRIDAELLYHAEHGVEIQFLHEAVMAYGRRWALRAQAVEEANAKRAELEGQGWVAVA